MDLEHSDALGLGLALTQTRGHGAARLCDEGRFLVRGAHGRHLRLDPALVLVAPEYQVQLAPEEVLGDVVLLAVLGPVLVRHEKVEPPVLVLLGLDHLDPLGAVQPVQTLVLDGGHAVEGEEGLSWQIE